MVTGIILTLDLVHKKRRGIFIGIVNFGMTFGVSLGAVLAGLVVPVLGWVSIITHLLANRDPGLTLTIQRVIFWVQSAATLVLGPALFFAIPSRSHHEPGTTKAAFLLQKLKNVDYAGALTLVRPCNLPAS